jgi:hypothetical protein
MVYQQCSEMERSRTNLPLMAKYLQELLFGRGFYTPGFFISRIS